MFSLVFFYLYYMCVCFSLFFSFLVSILYVNVRNALIKKRNKLKKRSIHPKVRFFIEKNF